MSFIFRFVLTLGLIIGIFTSCETPIVRHQESQISSDTPLAELQLYAMVEILKMAKDPQFRQFILAESLKQKHGDYNVYIKDIINAYGEVDQFKKSVGRLDTLVRLIKPLVGDSEPIVFYPRAETIEDQTSGAEARISAVTIDEPIGVVQPPVNSVPPDGTSGYMIRTDGAWYFVDYITEDFAWENDVFVIGTDESVEKNGRVNGGAEYAGLIQVTNLNAIEHWTSGKLEFRLIIRGANASDITSRSFDKVKRKYFKNNAWYDFGHSVGNWNVANWGNFTVENWWERDGGGSSSSTVTAPSSNGSPSVSYTVNNGEFDDNLGAAMVQFSDPANQVYQISYMNFKRKF